MANSDITKRAISAAFANLLETTEFGRITVTDIAKKCGINRQTFYYHFHDIYDLLSWTLKMHIREAIKSTPHPDWQHRLYTLLHGLKDSKSAVNHLVRSGDSTTVYYLLRDVFMEMVLDELNNPAIDLPISQEHLELVAEFYAGGLLEVVLSWIGNGMVKTPEAVVNDLQLVLQSDVMSRFVHQP